MSENTSPIPLSVGRTERGSEQIRTLGTCYRTNRNFGSDVSESRTSFGHVEVAFEVFVSLKPHAT